MLLKTAVYTMLALMVQQAAANTINMQNPPRPLIYGNLNYDISEEDLAALRGVSQAPSGYVAPSITSGERFNEKYLSQEIAEWSLRQVNGSLLTVSDPWVNQTIETMTMHMNAQVRQQALLAVPVIQDNGINAFAVPGGLIGLNTGTILAAGSLDEVASVLAHEIAHLSQRHYEHNQDNKKKLLALQLGGLLAAIAASAVSGDAATAAMIGTQTATAESAAGYSREHEREADRVGQQILAQSGYDAAAMPIFFERLYKQTSLNQAKNAFIPSFVKSHPFTAERLSEATSRARGMASPSMRQKALQAKEFDELVWRVKYLTKQIGLRELTIQATNSDGAKLALASYLADERRFDEAKRVMQTGAFDALNPLVCITNAHIANLQGDFKAATTSLTACQAIYPERRDLRIHLADNWIELGETAQAEQLLLPLLSRAPHDMVAWELTQKLYEHQAKMASQTTSKNLNTAQALRARSYVEFWRGNYVAALQSNASAALLLDEHASLQSVLEQDKAKFIKARDFKP